MAARFRACGRMMTCLFLYSTAADMKLGNLMHACNNSEADGKT
jgi:hypothetical protein